MKRCGGFISFKFIDDGVERSLGPECSLDVLNDTENILGAQANRCLLLSLCLLCFRCRDRDGHAGGHG